MDTRRQGDHVEIRVLSYFLMVAREENITKAAKLLHITQPTLSRQLMQLEEEPGGKSACGRNFDWLRRTEQRELSLKPDCVLPRSVSAGPV